MSAMKKKGRVRTQKKGMCFLHFLLHRGEGKEASFGKISRKKEGWEKGEGGKEKGKRCAIGISLA